MDAELFHIIEQSTWDEVRSQPLYSPDSLTTQGFIHLSRRSQILRPANLLYRGRSDLLVLGIDAGALTSEVVYEPGSHGETDLFPHLYGPLNLDAVSRTVNFPCGADGQFDLPAGL